MDSEYDYLKSFKKDELIRLYSQHLKSSSKEISDLRKEIVNLKKASEIKIHDMEERHEQQMYKMWKQHINTRFLEKFITDFICEKMNLSLEEGYDGCDSAQITGELKLGNRTVSSIQTYIPKNYRY